MEHLGDITKLADEFPDRLRRLRGDGGKERER